MPLLLNYPVPGTGRYVPPIADGELPDTAEAIQEEIEKQESLLSQLHQQLKSGSITQRREEQLWEAQRILTQLKVQTGYTRGQRGIAPLSAVRSSWGVRGGLRGSSPSSKRYRQGVDGPAG